MRLRRKVKSCAQDSACVTTLMEHVLTILKRENPEIENAFFRQDNTGCYHSANTVLTCKNISKRTGISIRRMDFSDPRTFLTHKEAKVHVTGLLPQ